MGDPIRKSDRLYTYRDYCGWRQGERWELIDGEAYDMSPAPLRKHQGISYEMARQIGNYLADKPCKAYSAPFDVRLPESMDQDDGDVDTVVQPDIVVICDRKKLDDRGCRGAPDWIVEILSPSTADKDLRIKTALYERHGVRELWIVHPTDQTVMVFTLDTAGAYGKPRFFGAQDSIPSAVFPDLVVDMKAAFLAAE